MVKLLLGIWLAGWVLIFSRLVYLSAKLAWVWRRGTCHVNVLNPINCSVDQLARIAAPWLFIGILGGGITALVLTLVTPA